MIEIDGSIGEGGGSVVRISAALATLLQKPIRIYKIRAKRKNPGLRPQHLQGLRALTKLCGGELEGAEVSSSEVMLRPGEIRGKKIDVNIGTAGSIGLVLQSLMIPAAFSDREVIVEFDGGASDTFFAPPLDYLINVTLPVLRKMGYSGEIEVFRRGHYPKGGGSARATIRPARVLRPLELVEAGRIESVFGISHCVKLPGHIAERQAKAAEETLAEAGYDTEIETEFYEKSVDPHAGPGTGIVLWANAENSVLGSSSLGEKGKPAEKVGNEAAEDLVKQLKTGFALDKWLTDQLVPYLALAPGRSVVTSAELTLHTMTNVELVRRILDAEIEVSGERGEEGRLKVEGRGPEDYRSK